MSEKIINIREDLCEVYIDWLNNFVTVPAFADFYGLQEDEAKKVIELGKKIHERCLKDAGKC